MLKHITSLFLAALLALSPIASGSADAGFFKKWAARGIEAELAETVIAHEEKIILERLAAKMAQRESRVAAMEELQAFAARHPKIAGRAERLLGKYAEGNRFNKVPYSARSHEAMLEDSLRSGETLSSKTLPKVTDKNVHLAGKGKDIQVLNSKQEAQLTGEAYKTVHVPYDERGFPVFDKFSKFDYKISNYKAHADPAVHMREATRGLRDAIGKGEVSKGQFTDAQMKAIKAGKPKIPDYTWHHHQDTGTMQLVPTEIHSQAGHIGGYAINQ